MRLRSLLAGLAGFTLLIAAAPADAAAGSPIPVGPYVDMGAWPTPSLSAMSAASGVKGFTLAFVNSYGCKASWFGAYDPRTAWQKEEITKSLNVVKAAKNAGVNLDLVNIMAMDYYQGAGDQGAKAISAAKATQAQLKSLYGLSDAAAWKKVGVTPMIGVNDSQNEIFYQKDAKALVAFAKTVHLGMLSFWEQGRDANACTGALYKCTNVPQSPYEFAKIFAGYTG